MIEVLVNPFQYRIGLALSKLSDKPTNWIVVVLAVIATIYAVTQWNNVANSRATAPGNGYPVIERNAIPETSRAPTNRAAVIPIRSAITNFRSSESSWQRSLAGTITLFFCFYCVWIVLAPASTSFLEIFTMQLPIFPFLFCIAFFSNADLFTVSFAINPAFLISLLFVFCMTSSGRFKMIFRVRFYALYRHLIGTLLAKRHPRITVFSPIEIRKGFPLMTVRASFAGYRLVDHIEVFLCGLVLGDVGKGTRGLPFKRVISPFYSYTLNYTSKVGELCPAI